MVPSDVFRKKSISLHQLFLLPTLFFLSPLSTSGFHSPIYSFIHSEDLAPTLCKAHMLSATGDLKMNSLDMEVGEGWGRQIHKTQRILCLRFNRTGNIRWMWNSQLWILNWSPALWCGRDLFKILSQGVIGERILNREGYLAYLCLVTICHLKLSTSSQTIREERRISGCDTVYPKGSKKDVTNKKALITRRGIRKCQWQKCRLLYKLTKDNFLDISAQQDMIFDIEMFSLFPNGIFHSNFISKTSWTCKNSTMNVHFCNTKTQQLLVFCYICFIFLYVLPKMSFKDISHQIRIQWNLMHYVWLFCLLSLF